MANFARTPQLRDEDGPVPSGDPTVVPRRRETIGDLLRLTRLGYQGDIEQIGAALRIRASYLGAIEQGRYDQLPGPVYALGFVRAYAGHLGLDPDEAVRRFKLESTGLERPRDLSFPVPLSPRSVPGGRILMAAFVMAICGYGLWYYLMTGSRARPERVAAVPAELLPPAPSRQADIVALTPPAASAATPAPAPQAENSAVAPSPPPSAVPPTASQTSAMAAVAPPPPATPAEPAAAVPSRVPPQAIAMLAPPPPSGAAEGAVTAPSAALGEAKIYGAVGGPARIVIRATSDSWVMVRDSDPAQTLISQRLLRAGDLYRVPADKTGFVLRTGNASALAFTVDGKAAPALGGTVRRNVRLDPDRLLAGTAAE